VNARIDSHSFTPKDSPVDLIIKPLEACNYSCDYCSSTDIAPENDPHAQLSLGQISQFLDAFPNTQTIIVNGGEPLLMPPSYYQSILNEIESRGMRTTLSLTSNLEPFMSNPSRWELFLKHSRVGICTSFEFGGLRKDKRGNPLTLERFLQIFNFFKKHIGYSVDFISVITDKNKEFAIQNVELAKELNVVCKLNYGVYSGMNSETFSLADMYSIYLQIYKKGLAQWEFSTRQMLASMSGTATACPLLRDCDKKIRAMNPGGDYYSCGALADDKAYPIDFYEELLSDSMHTPLQNDLNLNSMKRDCYACNLFSICNGCKKTIRDVKTQQKVEEHCQKMKELESELLALRNR